MTKKFTIELTRRQAVSLENECRYGRDVADALHCDWYDKNGERCKMANDLDAIVKKLRALPIVYEFPLDGNWKRPK